MSYHHKHRVYTPDDLDEHGQWLMSWARATAHGNCPTELLPLHGDDLAGYIALHAWRATKTWRPDGGANLHTYLELRAPGMVADYWRTVSFVGRDRARAITAGEARKVPVLSLEEYLEADSRNDFLLIEEGYEEAENRVDAELAGNIVHEALGRLETEDPRSAYCIRRHYLDGLTQPAIGRELGVTGSRICRINSQARARMRELIAA